MGLNFENGGGDGEGAWKLGGDGEGERRQASKSCRDQTDGDTGVCTERKASVVGAGEL